MIRLGYKRQWFLSYQPTLWLVSMKQATMVKPTWQRNEGNFQLTASEEMQSSVQQSLENWILLTIMKVSLESYLSSVKPSNDTPIMADTLVVGLWEPLKLYTQESYDWTLKPQRCKMKNVYCFRFVAQQQITNIPLQCGNPKPFQDSCDSQADYMLTFPWIWIIGLVWFMNHLTVPSTLILIYTPSI